MELQKCQSICLTINALGALDMYSLAFAFVVHEDLHYIVHCGLQGPGHFMPAHVAVRMYTSSARVHSDF